MPQIHKVLAGGLGWSGRVHVSLLDLILRMRGGERPMGERIDTKHMKNSFKWRNDLEVRDYKTLSFSSFNNRSYPGFIS